MQVTKRNQNGATTVDVRLLERDARVQEIARMIGGVEISQSTIAHAEDMLARASA